MKTGRQIDFPPRGPELPPHIHEVICPAVSRGDEAAPAEKKPWLVAIGFTGNYA